MGLKMIIVVMTSVCLVDVSRAEISVTEEKCKIKVKEFTLTTDLRSTVEDGISDQKYTSVLQREGEKRLWLKPESPMDAGAFNIGTKYTLVGAKTKLTLDIKKAKERSSFSGSEESACAPAMSVKEYDVEVKGLGTKARNVKMICDNRSVFVSSRCNKDEKPQRL